MASDQLTNTIIGNITDSINDGAEDVINDLVSNIVKRAGVQPEYLLYLQTICEGNRTIEKCASYDDAQAGM